LSLVYEYLNDEEAAISLWLDKEQVGEDITLSEHPKINRSSIMFAGTDNKELGNSLNGDIYGASFASLAGRSEEHTSELQSRFDHSFPTRRSSDLLSLVYEYLNDEEAAISLWLDKEQVGEDITLSEHPKINRSSIMFAGTDNKELGNSLNGDIYGASFASLEGEFSEKMFILHEGSCVVPDDLEPGQEIEID